MKKAVIICGGLGTRLRPVTYKIPKPMIKIGKKPLLEHLVFLCKKHYIEQIYLAVFYLPEVIINYFGDGKKWGLDIKISIEKKPLGSIGPLSLLKKKLGSAFFVLSGDAITNVDLTKMSKFHKKKRAFGTFLVHTTDHPYDSDLVEFDENFKIKRFFRPKKGNHFEPISKSGTHIFEPEVLKFIPENKKYSLEKDLIPDLLKKGKNLYAYYSNAYSKDIGTPERLQKARQDFKKIS